MPITATEQNALRIGVDVGGTFTDLVCFDPQSGELRVVKLPSTPAGFHLAVIEAVRRAVQPGRAVDIVHGSTVATNALLQRAGEPCAFVTTEGFRDMLLIGRQNRPDLYALHVKRPVPLTPAENWFTVKERISTLGQVVEPLDIVEIDRLIEQIRGRELRHVAVCLLGSFVNPIHEQMIGERSAKAELTVSLSSEILPEFREYERASTTVINASLRPTVEKYLGELSEGLRECDLGHENPGDLVSPRLEEERFSVSPQEKRSSSSRGETGDFGALTSFEAMNAEASHSRVDLRIMHSGGGTLTVKEAQKTAAKLVLSGPAGGLIGAAHVARAAGIGDVITYDMGGTSTDVATVIDGRPQWTTSSNVDGLPLGLATLDIHTVGAGGGSIAYLDAGGALRVGPRSAGAVPGPACYGRGGEAPTVTDANAVLGRILPDRFAGGAMRIEPELARQAIAPLAKAIGKSVVETALGIVRVAENNMSRAIRAVSSRRGLDPRRFTLLSFGGAGGLHACTLAESLEIPRVLVPPYCGVLSALGMVVAPPVVDVSKTVVQLGEQLDDDRLAAEFGGLSGQTMDVIPYEQSAGVEVFADVRFKGQSHELNVRIRQPSRDHIAQEFLKAYRERYGEPPKERTIEIVTLRVRRIGRIAELKLPNLESEKEESVEVETMGRDGRAIIALAMTRRSLLSQGRAEGPLLIIDAEATSLIPVGWSAAASENGSVIAERRVRIGY